MAVAFDAAAASASAASVASFTWTHTPSGTPRGATVFVFTYIGTTQSPTVTYGGTAMTLVATAETIDGDEDGLVQVFHLGASIPTGAQSVVVTRTNTAVAMSGRSFTVTAAADTETTGYITWSSVGTIGEESPDDGSPGDDSLRMAGFYSGVGTPANATTNSANAAGLDTGSTTGNSVTEATAGQGARALGWFASIDDDRAAVFLAVREVAAAASTGYINLLLLQAG